MIYEFYFWWRFWRYIVGIDPVPAGHVLLKYVGAQSAYSVRIEDTVYKMTNWRNYGIVPEDHAVKLQMKNAFKRLG